MKQSLKKRVSAIEARLSSQKEPLMIMRVFVAPDRDLSPEVTGIECNSEILPRLEEEAREALQERAFAHFKPIDAGTVVRLVEVF